MKAAITGGIGVYLVASGLLGAVQLVRGAEPALSWLGLCLAALPPMVCLILDRQPGPEGLRPALGYTVLSGLGLAITMSQSWKFGPAAGWIHLWAGLAFIAWVAYQRYLRASS